MMGNKPFYIVDVFAEKKYAGNQLAVVRHAGDLDPAEMLAITREMNYSETTFIISDETRDGGYDVRIFTPEEEVPFAGHPTLGTAFIIQNEILQQPGEKVILNLQVGKIPVTFRYSEHQPDELWMRQVKPAFGPTYKHGDIAASLGLREEDLDDRYPAQEVSTGLPFAIVPLKSLDALKRCRPREYKDILVFCPETYRTGNDLSVRVFTSFFGIPEDPATGSANGCLAGYLVKYSYCHGAEVNLRVEQGYEIHRPSLLLLHARERGGEIEINVGGQVFMVARGELIM